MEETVDLAIIGAGWHGLAALRTYVQVNPSHKIVLLESASSIGGVWANHRLYKGLKSNNQLGTYEYNDFPMDTETFGVKPREHIPGTVMHDYFEKYVDHYGMRNYIELDTLVKTVDKLDDGSWLIAAVQSRDGGSKPRSWKAAKLMVATGLTSEPFLPRFDGQDAFGAPLFHVKDLHNREDEILQAGKSITVFGASKSGWDAAYTCASAGMKVDFVIRASGHGPAWMAPPFVTPLKLWLEKLATTRFLTWFSPCIWGNEDGFGIVRRFLHGTWLGRKVVSLFWFVLTQDLIGLVGFDRHPETKKLKPWVAPFWTATSLSILNYPTDFFDYVRNGTIKVHIADVDHLSPHTVHLSDGQNLQTSAMICVTGWKATPNIRFTPGSLEQELGFPWGPDPIDPKMSQQADKEILRRYPALRNQPVVNPQFKDLAEDAPAVAPHPLRLTRFLVPPSLLADRSIVFLGMTLHFNAAMVAQVQALWATAYFAGKTSIRTLENHSQVAPDSRNSDHDTDIAWETALHTQFGKWRYPGGLGKRNPDFVFDVVPYIDMLLQDLGLNRHRKSGLLAECFQGYGVEDYTGLVQEWKDLHNAEVNGDS